MNEKLQETVETFQMLDPQLRLEMLLDYSANLPPTQSTSTPSATPVSAAS